MPKHHREYCAHCLKGGDLICCDECERTFHLRCVRNIYKSQVEIEDDSVFNCPECLLFPDRYYIPISNLLANPELHKKYRDIICYRLYDTEIVSSVNSLPTMRMLLLYLEFVVPPQQIKILAKLVSRYVPYLDKPFAHRELGLNFNCLVASLREAVSSDVFDDAYHNLLEGKTALAFATIPSPTYFSNPCPTCKHHRYFHCFCYFCGHVFNVVEDYKADMMRYSNFNPLNSVIVAQANVRSVSTSKFVSQKDRVVAIETFPPPEMQGGGSSSDASDNSVCSIQMPVQSPYTPEVLDNAVPKNHCDPEDDTLSGNSKNYNKAISELHERALSLVSLNQREETALKGIEQLIFLSIDLTIIINILLY